MSKSWTWRLFRKTLGSWCSEAHFTHRWRMLTLIALQVNLHTCFAHTTNTASHRGGHLPTSGHQLWTWPCDWFWPTEMGGADHALCELCQVEALCFFSIPPAPLPLLRQADVWRFSDMLKVALESVLNLDWNQVLLSPSTLSVKSSPALRASGRRFLWEHSAKHRFRNCRQKV